MKPESLKTLNDLTEVTQLISSRAGTDSELSQILGYCYHKCTPCLYSPRVGILPETSYIWLFTPLSNQKANAFSKTDRDQGVRNPEGH